MRIISGKSRGIRLDTPSGIDTRPTTDRVKENIFNIIQFEIIDANVLDLFSGSGSLGIEALSRGAKFLISVDSNKECVGIIKNNLLRAKLIDRANVQNKTVEQFFSFTNDDKFDIIFADPPYNKGLCDYVLNMLSKSKLLSDNAIIVLEHSKDENLEFESDDIFIDRNKIYGNTAISIYRRSTK